MSWIALNDKSDSSPDQTEVKTLVKYFERHIFALFAFLAICFVGTLFFLIPNFEQSYNLNLADNKIDLDSNIRIVKEKINNSFFPEDLRLILAKLFIRKAKSADNVEDMFTYYGEAIAEYKKVLKVKPSKEIYLELAKIQMILGRPRRAISNLSLAKNIDPNDVELSFLLGDALFQIDKHQRAKSELEYYLKNSNVKLQKAYFLLARISLHEDDNRMALARFEIALKKNPEDFDTHYWMGETHGKLGNIESAIRSYKKAAALDPEELEPHVRLGHLYLYTKDFKNAVIHFAKILELEKNNTDALDGLGYAQIELKEFNQAKNSFRKALALDAKKASSYYGLAVCMVFDEELNLALDYLKVAFQNDATYKSYAQKDSYLEPLWNKKRFKLALEEVASDL